MLQLLGSPRHCCDGLTRRETLKAGAIAALGGLSLPKMLEAEARADFKPGKAKNVIMLFLLGGAATQDMYDLKPTGPTETRGEFQPISTSVPGLQICEHLPRMAQWMHKVAVIRSVNHKAGCHNCLPAYTGLTATMPDQHPRDTDPPSMGSVVEWLRVKEGRTGADVFPDYVYMPCWLGWGQVFRRSGPYGGFLGKRFDALTTECSPFKDKDAPPTKPGSPNTVRGVPILPDSVLVPEVTLDRLDDRRNLLQQFDDGVRRVEAGGYDRTRDRAFGLLTSAKARAAFDLSTVDSRVIERYGRTLFGQSTLIARRLIESGVRFVNVTWDLFWDRVQVDYDAWDTHTRNFPILKNNKLPGFDQTFSALMEDLDARGMLDETLIVVTSEMGRTPKINGNGGRDHWTYCYGSLLAGAGIKGGSVYGASDAQAAYVKDLPVSPADLCCTVYEALGIDSHMTVPDKTGRPVPIDQGGPSDRAIVGVKEIPMRRFAMLACLAIPVAIGAEEPKVPSIKAIMDEAHRCRTNYISQVRIELAKEAGPDWAIVEGKSRELIRMGKLLAKNTPPKGTPEAWEKITSIYVANATLLTDAAERKDKDTAVRHQKALTSMCATCHRAHR